MDLPELRRVLLGLTGPDSPVPDLSAADWAELDRIAAQHRLQPLLHSLHRGKTGVPAAIAATWQAAHRFHAMQAMVQRAELAETCAILADEGIPAVALKGAWLAAQAYPDPALRPMRDIDLLVPQADIIRAFERLLAAGYRQAGPAELTLAETVRIDKHMPPLAAPRGTMIELHHRLWERDGRLDHASPNSSEIDVLARAIREEDGISYPAAEDLLGHVIVHAVYSHRLDVGPLVLCDVEHLLRAAPVDWTRFWAAAAANRWREGARLVLELVDRYRPGVAIDFSADAGPPAPPELLRAAPDLLLQDLATRASAGLAAKTIKQGPAGLAERITGRRKVVGEAAVTRAATGPGGRLGWAGSRALRSLRELARADVRRQSRQLAALSQWLDR
ncbi:MAG: nucleotidyltransferase family protein [Novosphingobium sp.]